jgi:hypothetical protein
MSNLTTNGYAPAVGTTLTFTQKIKAYNLKSIFKTRYLR